MGGDWRPAGRGQEAVRTQRAGTKRKSRRAGLRDAGPRPEGSAAHSRDRREAHDNAAAPSAATAIIPAVTTEPPSRRIPNEKCALGATAGGAACARRCDGSAITPLWPEQRGALFTRHTLSRRTAKTGAPSAQRGQNEHAIPVGACRRQRAPIGNRALSSGGVAGASSPSGWGTARRGWPSGEGFPLAFQVSNRIFPMGFDGDNCIG